MDAATRDALVSALRESIPKKQLAENAPMTRYTTLRLGGPAELMCEIASAEQLSTALAAADALHVPVTLLGNGSNILVRDGGIRGLIIHIGEQFAEVSAPAPLPDGRIALTAQAGATLQKLCNAAADYALTGIEFASGIPGTVGGAAYMNAGAYGGEMKDVISGVTACESDGRTVAYTNEEMSFGYRKSRLTEAQGPVAVASVTVCLTPGDEDTIRATMREFSARRREKQPLSIPSCGSTFKRPVGQFAGKLIEDCGLRGFRVGGAAISEKHCGFVVNLGNATCADVVSLTEQVRQIVLEKTGCTLEREIRVVE